MFSAYGTIFSKTLFTWRGFSEVLRKTIPLLLAGVSATGALFRGQELSSVSRWLGLAAGFGLLYFFVALATFEYVLEE